MAAKPSLQITVVYAPKARQVLEVQLTLAANSTVAQSLQASGLLVHLSPQAAAHATVGIWGRKVTYEQALRDHDRIEIYRELTVDPKVARRERFVKQGSKGTGLFAKKRPGAAAGY
jgi:putative ubiquitin-RnfH superfamily antitoxin RatB of RatAB toxin-antitoxin module